MGFGEGIREKLINLFSVAEISETPEKLINFTEAITDQTLSKSLSYSILEAIAQEDREKLLDIVKKEYLNRNFVLSVNLREYPDLFNRRIYVPIRYNLLEMTLAIIASLRTSDYEACSLLLDGRNYNVSLDSDLINIAMLDLRSYSNVSIVYGHDSWTFDISIIGLTYVRDDEIQLPYLVEDAVGYGIMGMNKQRLFNQLDDSKDLALDTKNPIMDDEEYEFYNADTDDLNENSNSEYLKARKEYLGNE